MRGQAHDPLRNLIEQTSDAYGSYGHLNADYPEFASLALADFKNALGNPKLTARELRALLRQAIHKHATQHNTDKSWSAFMASYVSTQANANDELAEA